MRPSQLVMNDNKALQRVTAGEDVLITLGITDHDGSAVTAVTSWTLFKDHVDDIEVATGTDQDGVIVLDRDLTASLLGNYIFRLWLEVDGGRQNENYLLTVRK